MKKLILSMALALSTLLSFSCVDLHPAPIDVTVNVDSITCDIEIRIDSLQMFGGAENEFCSCAYTGILTGGVQLEYLAFVYTGTNDPLPGFEFYTFSDLAGQAWDDADPGNFDWNGLVSAVTATGIEPGIFVDLVIRFSWDNPQWDCTELETLQELLSGGGIATDEWDPTTNSLADSHQSISFFTWDNILIQYQLTSYFEALDASILGFYNNIEAIENPQIEMWPNPATEEVYIKSNKPIGEVIVLNAVGQQVKTVYSAANTIRIETDQLPSGLYTVITAEGIRKKLIVGQ